MDAGSAGLCRCACGSLISARSLAPSRCPRRSRRRQPWPRSPKSWCVVSWQITLTSRPSRYWRSQSRIWRTTRQCSSNSRLDSQTRGDAPAPKRYCALGGRSRCRPGPRPLRMGGDRLRVGCIGSFPLGSRRVPRARRNGSMTVAVNGGRVGNNASHSAGTAQWALSAVQCGLAPRGTMLMTGVRPKIELYLLRRVAEAYDRMMGSDARFRVALTSGN